MQLFFSPDYECGIWKIVTNKILFEEKVLVEGILGEDDRFVLVNGREFARTLLLLQRRDMSFFLAHQ